MDFRACLELLGLADEPDLTRERVRRVYLRKLRDFPPEKDPEGFRRLREAFEYVREVVPDRRRTDEDVVSVDPAAAAWKADAAPGIVIEKPPAVEKLAEKDDSSLWDPIVRAPEPEVPFVEPPATAAPAPTAAPPPSAAPPPAAATAPPEVVRVELPPIAPPEVVRVELPPIARPEADEPPLTLAQLVPTLLRLLEDGSVNAAFAIEEDWRDRGDLDDVRNASDLLAVRWALLRELMTVAREVKAPVVQAFARAISAGDVSLARPDLEAFKKADPKAAGQAHGVLAAYAKNLHKATDGALYTPPAPRPQYYANFTPPPPSRSSGSGGWRIVSVFAIAISAFLRFAMTDHTSSYDYHPIDIPKFDPNLYNPNLYNVPPLPPSYDPSLYSYTPPTLPPAPGWVNPESDRSVLLDELVTETMNLSTYSLVPSDAQTKVDTFLGDALDDACPRMRRSFLKIEKLRAVEDADKAAAAKEQLAGIRERLDIVCPKKKSPRK